MQTYRVNSEDGLTVDGNFYPSDAVVELDPTSQEVIDFKFRSKLVETVHAPVDVDATAGNATEATTEKKKYVVQEGAVISFDAIGYKGGDLVTLDPTDELTLKLQAEGQIVEHIA